MIDNVEEEVEMLERHVTILGQVAENEPIGIVSLSKETEISQHKVRYSLRILEENNLVEPTGQGAILTDEATEFVNSTPDRIDELISQLEGLKTMSRPAEA